MGRRPGETADHADKRRSIAPGEPQRHRGHRGEHRRNHEDTKNTKERNLLRRGCPEWSGGNAGDRDRRLPGRSPSVPNASVRPRRSSPRPTRRARRSRRGCDVGSWLCVLSVSLRFLRTGALHLRPCVQAGIERPEFKIENSKLRIPRGGGLTDEDLSTIYLV